MEDNANCAEMQWLMLFVFCHLKRNQHAGCARTRSADKVVVCCLCFRYVVLGCSGPGVETDGKNLPLSLVRGLIWSTTTCSAYLKHGFCIWFCMYVVVLVFTILPLYTYKANEIVGFWWQFRLADTSYIVHMLPKKIHPNAMCSELCECGNVTARDGATSC